MRYKKTAITFICLTILLITLSFAVHEWQDIPKLWDVAKIKSGHLPLVDRSISLEPITEDLYNRIRERVVYKTYPFYMPGSEPKGYYEWLLKQEPAIVFNAADMRSEKDWIAAGELIYEMPQNFDRLIDSTANLDELKAATAYMKQMHIPVDKNGIFPYFQLVVRKKGLVEVGSFSCGNCHNKVMPDGSVLKGGQGNYPFDKIFGSGLWANISESGMPDSAAKKMLSGSFNGLFGAPWIKHASQEAIKNPDPKNATGILMATVPGVMHRHSSILGAPTVIPDLFNIKDRKYLDRTGLILNRDISDIMRYAALNQEMDFTNSYGGFKPDSRPDSVIIKRFTRFSDAQAFALAKYIYSLKPLPNPQKASQQLIAQGKELFRRETCISCHTPPLYTNNKLSPALGFLVPAEDKQNGDIMDVSVKTDPTLALYSRRGTGYYKVPSLIGVWNRQALMHSGYVTNLEEMFNPARMNDDFVPSGFNPNIDKPFAVKGHDFGLDISEQERKALIAFLRSL